MVMLTGGEKYRVKQIIVKISEVYPSIKEITSKGNYSSNELSSLYKQTLDILNVFISMTTNIINSSKVLSDFFNLAQEVHKYKSVSNNNKDNLISLAKMVPDLQEELINMVESDTTNRDAVLRQIMDELGIVDPNAKKKHSLW